MAALIHLGRPARLAVLLAMSGCGGSPAPTASPHPTPTATPAPTPLPTPAPLVIDAVQAFTLTPTVQGYPVFHPSERAVKLTCRTAYFQVLRSGADPVVVLNVTWPGFTAGPPEQSDADLSVHSSGGPSSTDYRGTVTVQIADVPGSHQVVVTGVMQSTLPRSPVTGASLPQKVTLHVEALCR